uniref:Nitrogen fixation protein fixG n=1 Tax=Magnetococcus massalia (strain MO-1) TaxID=451514 RepID=A0A1S7LH03_MAGMO|nr:Nitrogen fixation protein fixG [Candidatus Magnetococcus massalia]
MAVAEEGQSETLYADWKKLYPRYQDGFFRSLRWAVLVVLMGIYYILPLMRWQRDDGLPNQAVLFDLPTRKFYIFDLVIWPQEIFLLALLLFAAAIGLFFITALAGRVFCGYFCFQTVWTDLFIYVEKMWEGNRKKRMKLDENPWTAKWIIAKTGKHITWIVVSLLTGGVFVFYFADAPTLMGQFMDGTAPSAAWSTLGILTLGTYTMAGFAREQVCIYMCPYARFQGAMFDEDTIIIAYHPELGEPREANRRVRQDKKDDVGWCIDCNECVTVCPTGIDIRDGQQYQCITCGACIDACDEVMASLAKESEAPPPRLVRYTSMAEMSGGETNFGRARVWIYALMLIISLGSIWAYFLARQPIDLNVIRDRQPIYIPLSDGSVQNNYTMRVLNMSNHEQSYVLTLEGLPGSSMKAINVEKSDAQGNLIFTVGPGKVVPFKVFVKQNRENLNSGQQEVTFQLRSTTEETGGSDRYESVFMRP